MDLLSVIGQHLSPGAIDQIGEQIGATPQQTQAGLAAALPALLGGLARNTSTPQGAANLNQALERDHDGGLLDSLGGLLGGGRGGGAMGALGGLLGGGGAMGALGGLLGGGGRSTDGAGILGHVLGGRQGAVEQGVSRASGLGRGQVLQLLMLAAPLVMSALGKMKRQQGLDAQGVANVIDREQREVAGQIPGNRSGLMDLLDRDDDGSIADDVAQIGTALGGAFLLSRMGRR